MYSKPEIDTLGSATALIQGTKSVSTEIANVDDQREPESLYHD